MASGAPAPPERQPPVSARQLAPAPDPGPEAGAPPSTQRPPAGLTDGARMAPRRHALLEQSLERDAALSLRPASQHQHHESSKWRRTASIKRALKQASLVGRPERRADTGLADSAGSGARLKQFQPPVSERALQRCKRRGAMSNDPRRQLSADVLGIRQLTNEYLQNAGVSPGGGGLVTLDAAPSPASLASLPHLELGGGAPLAASLPAPTQPPPPPPPPSPPPVPLPMLAAAASNAATVGGGQHARTLTGSDKQAGKLALDHHQIDSALLPRAGAGAASLVQTHPGHMPWQSDVSVQCELVQAPRLHESPAGPPESPYETTGDLLRTLAGPYPRLQLAQFHSTTSFDSSTTTHQLSASLKRGLSALSAANQHHHLSPSAGAAIQVVGSIKKSISSTLDIGRMATGGCLHSQDSLPAYSSLRNEEEEEEEGEGHQQYGDTQDVEGTGSQQVSVKKSSRNNNASTSSKSSATGLNHQSHEQAVDNSLLGQLTSKLVRQSSCKLSVGKRGLQRALSFDCRGYKRLDKQEQQQQQQHQFQQHLTVPSAGQADTFVDASKKQMQNKSLLSLDSSGRRPYSEQLASRVDFQLPLLPYHKMQEAVVAQRLIEPGHQHQLKEQPYQQHPQHQLAAEGAKASLANADELICARAPDTLESPLIPEMSEMSEMNDSAAARQHQQAAPSAAEPATSGPNSSATTGGFFAASASRQTLSIPVIAHETRQKLIQCHRADSAATETSAGRRQDARASPTWPTSGDAPAAEPPGPEEQTQIVCLPSPSVVPDKTFEIFPATGSRQATQAGADGEAGPLKCGSSVADTLAGPLRNRRPAIVPPKLVTDSDDSTAESQVATSRLIDLDDEQQATHQPRRHYSDQAAHLSTDEPAPATSDTGGHRPQHLAVRRRSISEHQITGLPTFYIEPNENESLSQAAPGPATQSASDQQQQSLPHQAQHRRPDSQMTQADSIISSGSSGNLSNLGRKDFSLASPCGSLKVNFGCAINRRRSSIAVIPQMQICPGDLLVYSKQLIDRMNQPPDELDRPRFLPIDDKKAKNIWSSFKLFDNRTVRAREELLNSLEDVLASLQPSTFVDEQLSHYKGMAWNEFLYETESRRSASSERDILCLEQGRVKEKAQQCTASGSTSGATHSNLDTLTKLSHTTANMPLPREPLKATLSSSATAGPAANRPHEHLSDTGRDCAQVKGKLREKPKLRRGQTVDSVFRIPLIPSSPLKHAQQHQQTPTAHLEEIKLNTIEDNESATSSQSGSRTGRSSVKRNKSSSCSSRAGVNRTRTNATLQDEPEQVLENDGAELKQLESSFETDDALDILLQNDGQQTGRGSHQLARQASLSTLSSIITRTEQKRQRALWDLFQSECTFFFDHLLTLKNVYMEPLKKIQVEGFAMFADPDTLFGNLDELCCGVYDFCKEFLLIIMRTLKTRPEELNATDVLIKLYKRNPKIDHLRGVYHRYTLNYINALTYLESLRKQVEFVEFEKWSSHDVRCKKLQLTDLLVAPVQHIMRVPIILRDIESHTENSKDRDEIRAILAVEEASLRELDDKMRWLKNFERLLEIQKSISWPSVLELDPKIFVPESLKENLSKQPCERLIVSPRRQIIYEGNLSSLDTGKPSDMHVILFDDMLLLTRRKKCLTKRTSNVCKTNPSGSANKDEALVKYMVYKQPLGLDRFYVQDVQPIDAQSSGYKHMFLLIVTNRYQQIVGLHSFIAANEDNKQTWLFKIKKTSERWKRNFSNDQQNAHQHQQRPIDETHVNNQTSKPDTTSHDQIYKPKVVDLEDAMRTPITLEQPQSIRSQNLALGLRTNVSANAGPKSGDPPETAPENNDMNNNMEQNHEMELVVMSTKDNSESSSYPTSNAVYTASAH